MEKTPIVFKSCFAKWFGEESPVGGYKTNLKPSMVLWILGLQCNPEHVYSKQPITALEFSSTIAILDFIHKQETERTACMAANILKEYGPSSKTRNAEQYYKFLDKEEYIEKPLSEIYHL